MSDLDRCAATRPARRTHPFVEELEPRVVPSVVGLTPAQVRHAYGFDGIAGDGRGQTIALVVGGDAPTAAGDLHTFDAQFGLPDVPLTRAAPQGTPAVDPRWVLEAALDVEWAHAAAPGASLLLVEARSGGLTDLIAAADYARRQPGVSVVSMSWGSAEFPVEGFFDGTFTTPAGHPGVAFVAASGDGGAARGLWPAFSPNVLSVGGTQLTSDAAGNYVGESAWAGSGGGTSLYETGPAAQRAVTGSARRTGPDVSYNASPASGYAVYTSTPASGVVGWVTMAGTSAAAPQWAGLLAVADQARALAGQAPLADAVSAIYSLPTADFHDVTAGAAPGYDTLTGRGTPYAARVVAGLVGPAAANPPPVSTPTRAPTPAPTPAPALAPPKPLAPNFGASARSVANFLQKTTGAAPALRLPSGDSSFLGADVVRALQPDRSAADRNGLRTAQGT